MLLAATVKEHYIKFGHTYLYFCSVYANNKSLGKSVMTTQYPGSASSAVEEHGQSNFRDLGLRRKTVLHSSSPLRVQPSIPRDAASRIPGRHRSCCDVQRMSATSFSNQVEKTLITSGLRRFPETSSMSTHE